MEKLPSSNEPLQDLLSRVDPRMVAIGLACASLTPSLAGQAGAVAAIAFDAKHRQWYGVALSAASMIPLLGYAPGAFKVAWLVRLLDRDLKLLEDRLPEFHQSADSVAQLRAAFEPYYRKLPDMKLTRPLRNRLANIMALDAGVQPAATDPEAEAIANSVSNP